jgi:short-subunit dehydrogenase
VDYRGKVAVVTGASSGIGWEAARAFARRGAVVVAVARREERLRELVEECRRDSPVSSYLAGDLADAKFAEGVIADTVARHGGLDVLVNNAALTKHKQVYHLSAAEVEHVTRVNFLSAVWTTLAAIPPMLTRGGGFIVNVSSFAAKVAPPREAVYAATKAALSAFTEGLWLDLAGSNIHAALVVPGAIDTEIWGKQEEPARYAGPKHPPALVVDAIFEAIEKRRHELTVPRRNLALVTARLLRLIAPALLRRGMARFDPVPAEVIERARARALEAARRHSG